MLDGAQRNIFLAGRLVEPGGMALAESTAARILARQADAVVLLAQAADGQRLGGRPVDPLAAFQRLALGFEDAPQRLVDGEARGTVVSSFVSES